MERDDATDPLLVLDEGFDGSFDVRAVESPFGAAEAVLAAD